MIIELFVEHWRNWSKKIIQYLNFSNLFPMKKSFNACKYKEMNMEAIFEVMNKEIQAWQDLTHDLCKACTALYQLNNWTGNAVKRN